MKTKRKKPVEPQGPIHVPQIELFALIAKFVDRHGGKQMIPRQVNAIIAAANLVVEAYAEPFRPAVQNMGLAAWLESDDTGMSSRFMAAMLRTDEEIPVPLTKEERAAPVPHDPEDFGRCLRLLDAVPHFRKRLDRLEAASGAWGEIVRNWTELEEMYRRGDGKRLLARMKELGC